MVDLKTFIRRKNGLCNRLEMLMAAYAIRRMHGHSILVDWPEAPFMQLPMVQEGRPDWWRRLAGYHVLHDECDPSRLGGFRTIDLRGVETMPATLVEQEIRTFGPKIGPTSLLADAMGDGFSGMQGKPVVGIHIRQGDFAAAGEDSYRAQFGLHARVPIWWYHHMMSLISAAKPDVVFLLSVNGDMEPLRPLMSAFNCVVSNFAFDFELPRSGHLSQSNPVADLFVLAACSVMLGTPASSFSHWAASNLGPPTTVVSPALEMTRESPSFRISALRHRPLRDWVHLSWRDANWPVLTRWDASMPSAQFDSRWWHAPDSPQSASSAAAPQSNASSSGSWAPLLKSDRS